MQREMQNRENNPRNPNQPERRQDDRRHQEQQPNEERRRQERRENNPTTGQMSGPGQRGQMAQGGRETRGADEKQNFGERYDRDVGQRREHHEGAGGKTDGTQRDIGRTGQDK